MMDPVVVGPRVNVSTAPVDSERCYGTGRGNGEVGVRSMNDILSGATYRRPSCGRGHGTGPGAKLDVKHPH